MTTSMELRLQQRNTVNREQVEYRRFPFFELEPCDAGCPDGCRCRYRSLQCSEENDSASPTVRSGVLLKDWEKVFVCSLTRHGRRTAAASRRPVMVLRERNCASFRSSREKKAGDDFGLSDRSFKNVARPSLPGLFPPWRLRVVVLGESRGPSARREVDARAAEPDETVAKARATHRLARKGR